MIFHNTVQHFQDFKYSKAFLQFLVMMATLPRLVMPFQYVFPKAPYFSNSVPVILHCPYICSCVKSLISELCFKYNNQFYSIIALCQIHITYLHQAHWVAFLFLHADEFFLRDICASGCKGEVTILHLTLQLIAQDSFSFPAMRILILMMPWFCYLSFCYFFSRLKLFTPFQSVCFSCFSISILNKSCMDQIDDGAKIFNFFHFIYQIIIFPPK